MLGHSAVAQVDGLRHGNVAADLDGSAAAVSHRRHSLRQGGIADAGLLNICQVLSNIEDCRAGVVKLQLEAAVLIEGKFAQVRGIIAARCQYNSAAAFVGTGDAHRLGGSQVACQGDCGLAPQLDASHISPAGQSYGLFGVDADSADSAARNGHGSLGVDVSTVLAGSNPVVGNGAAGNVQRTVGIHIESSAVAAGGLVAGDLAAVHIYHACRHIHGAAARCGAVVAQDHTGMDVHGSLVIDDLGILAARRAAVQRQTRTGFQGQAGTGVYPEEAARQGAAPADGPGRAVVDQGDMLGHSAVAQVDGLCQGNVIQDLDHSFLTITHRFDGLAQAVVGGLANSADIGNIFAHDLQTAVLPDQIVFGIQVSDGDARLQGFRHGFLDLDERFAYLRVFQCDVQRCLLRIGECRAAKDQLVGGVNLSGHAIHQAGFALRGAAHQNIADGQRAGIIDVITKFGIVLPEIAAQQCRRGLLTHIHRAAVQGRAASDLIVMEIAAVDGQPATEQFIGAVLIVVIFHRYVANYALQGGGVIVHIDVVDGQVTHVINGRCHNAGGGGNVVDGATVNDHGTFVIDGTSTAGHIHAILNDHGTPVVYDDIVGSGCRQGRVPDGHCAAGCLLQDRAGTRLLNHQAVDIHGAVARPVGAAQRVGHRVAVNINASQTLYCGLGAAIEYRPAIFHVLDGAVVESQSGCGGVDGMDAVRRTILHLHALNGNIRQRHRTFSVAHIMGSGFSQYRIGDVHDGAAAGVLQVMIAAAADIQAADPGSCRGGGIGDTVGTGAEDGDIGAGKRTTHIADTPACGVLNCHLFRGDGGSADYIHAMVCPGTIHHHIVHGKLAGCRINAGGAGIGHGNVMHRQLACVMDAVGGIVVHLGVSQFQRGIRLIHHTGMVGVNGYSLRYDGSRAAHPVDNTLAIVIVDGAAGHDQRTAVDDSILGDMGHLDILNGQTAGVVDTHAEATRYGAVMDNCGTVGGDLDLALRTGHDDTVGHFQRTLNVQAANTRALHDGPGGVHGKAAALFNADTFSDAVQDGTGVEGKAGILRDHHISPGRLHRAAVHDQSSLVVYARVAGGDAAAADQPIGYMGSATVDQIAAAGGQQGRAVNDTLALYQHIGSGVHSVINTGIRTESQRGVFRNMNAADYILAVNANILQRDLCAVGQHQHIRSRHLVKAGICLNAAAAGDGLGAGDL